MKIKISLILAIILTHTVMAETINHGKLVLDQSQEIYFEQYLANAFALQLFQAKNKFDVNTLVVGGLIEVNAQHWQGNTIITSPAIDGYKSGNGVYLTEVDLDFFMAPTSWLTTFLSIAGLQLGQGGENNNYFYVPHAFVNVGNLDSLPTYLTLGINTLPFGVLTGTGLWDTPITSLYFNVQQVPQIGVGYYKNNWNLNALAYNDQYNYENHFVFSLSYNKNSGNFNYGFGAGYLTNLKTNSTGNMSTNKKRKRHVQVGDLGNIYDANANIGYKQLALSGEFLMGSRKLATATHQPAAYSLTLLFAPKLFDTVTTFGVNYSASLNLANIPATLPGQDATILAATGLKSAWAISVSRSYFRDNITLGIDLQQARTYDNKQTYAGTLELLIYI